LFAIRCNINQAVQVKNATNIIVITGAIYALFPHLYQLQSKILELFSIKVPIILLLSGITLVMQSGFII